MEYYYNIVTHWESSRFLGNIKKKKKYIVRVHIVLYNKFPHNNNQNLIYDLWESCWRKLNANAKLHDNWFMTLISILIQCHKSRLPFLDFRSNSSFLSHFCQRWTQVLLRISPSDVISHPLSDQYQNNVPSFSENSPL